MFCVSVGLSDCLFVIVFMPETGSAGPLFSPASFLRPWSSSFLISFNLQCQQRLTFDCKTTHTSTSTSPSWSRAAATSTSIVCIFCEILSGCRDAQTPLENCQLIKRCQLATCVEYKILNRNWNRNPQPCTWTTPQESRWGVLKLSGNWRGSSHQMFEFRSETSTNQTLRPTYDHQSSILTLKGLTESAVFSQLFCQHMCEEKTQPQPKKG